MSLLIMKSTEFPFRDPNSFDICEVFKRKLSEFCYRVNELKLIKFVSQRFYGEESVNIRSKLESCIQFERCLKENRADKMRCFAHNYECIQDYLINLFIVEKVTCIILKL